MNKSFYRKVIYAAGIILLLFPIMLLGAPSSRGGKGKPDEAGGKLAQLRSEAKLGQADLGAIDPASETIRMATLGLRGMAVTMLWSKANEYKKTEDWTAFQATLDQLARLQPYFVKVWQYQAWNLSYNVSVELDNVRDRFYYVKQGIQYLKDGIVYLRDNPSLLEDLGWFSGNKVGRADEHEQYRRLFKLDDDLHPESRLPEDRDNWLVSKDWYKQAISAVDDRKQPLGTKNPVTFFASPARSQMSFAEAIEEEGVFRDRARQAWKEGSELWNAYGSREMRSTQGFLIRLVDMEMWQKRANELQAELEGLIPGIVDQMRTEAVASLTPAQKELVQSLPAEPTDEEYKLHESAMEALNVSPEKIASRIAKDEPEKASRARRLAKEIDDALQRVNSIATNREVANYDYWESRGKLEQTADALNARELAHNARRASQDEADPTTAKELYEKSFDLWAKVLAASPATGPESVMGSEVMDLVKEYNSVLEQLDLSLADKDVSDRFALWNVVETNDQERKFADVLEIYHARMGKPVAKAVDSPGADQAKPAIDPGDALITPAPATP